MKNILLAGIFISSVVFTSCGPSRVVVRERPVPPVAVRPHSPGPSYVWVDGGWIRNGRRGYVYKQGYWTAPRYRGAVYKQGYWKPSRRGYVWVPGRW